jgi:hypothetical protein
VPVIFFFGGVGGGEKWSVVSFKVLASARIVCNIVCVSARSNPQRNCQKSGSCLTNLILT